MPVRCAAFLLALSALCLPAPEAAAHGGGPHYGPPPIVVVPHPGAHQAYPYWYYGRPSHRRHGPPPYVLVPAPPYYAPPGYYYGRPHHHGRRSGFSFSFRF
jgi:hypothetical protein